MSGVWPAQRVFEKVRRVSDLLSCVCIPGKTAGSGEIKLVDWIPGKRDHNQIPDARDREIGENNGD